MAELAYLFYKEVEYKYGILLRITHSNLVSLPSLSDLESDLRMRWMSCINVMN